MAKPVRSIPILPGVWLNIGGAGISWSFGLRRPTNGAAEPASSAARKREPSRLRMVVLGAICLVLAGVAVWTLRPGASRPASKNLPPPAPAAPAWAAVEKELRQKVAEQDEEIESLNEELEKLRQPAADEGPNYQSLYLKANNAARLWKESAEENATAKAKADELAGELATARQRVEALGAEVEKLKFDLWFWKKKAGIPETAPKVVVDAPRK